MIDDEEFTTCPYNASHRILRSRIHHHLIKCEKTGPKLLICPFNATHRYPEHLYKDHCDNCPSRRPEQLKTGSEQQLSIGARTKPKPILQKEYLPEDDPENDYWDD